VRRAYELYEKGRVYRRGCQRVRQRGLENTVALRQFDDGKDPEASASRRTTAGRSSRAMCSLGARAMCQWRGPV
jgi:hypothetical protein